MQENSTMSVLISLQNDMNKMKKWICIDITELFMLNKLEHDTFSGKTHTHKSHLLFINMAIFCSLSPKGVFSFSDKIIKKEQQNDGAVLPWGDELDCSFYVLLLSEAPAWWIYGPDWKDDICLLVNDAEWFMSVQRHYIIYQTHLQNSLQLSYMRVLKSCFGHPGLLLVSAGGRCRILFVYGDTMNWNEEVMKWK